MTNTTLELTSDAEGYVDIPGCNTTNEVLKYIFADAGIVLEIDDDNEIEFEKSGGGFFDIRKNGEMHELSGCVYCLGNPENTDAQNDYISDFEELKKGSASWLANGGIVKLQHEHDTTCRVVESFVTDSEITYRGEKISAGCWVATVSVPPEVFKKVADSSLRGFSMAGTAQYTEV
ncbi:MAG: hypothetical protein KAV00_03625 [Phycisphaerae bacterium]|nr:hypothetical protein [Phycisphaerae bacterium]